MVKEGDKFIGNGVKIKQTDLSNKEIVQKHTKEIEPYLLFENIFVTVTPLKWGFTCAKPELLFNGQEKQNCTNVTFWIDKDSFTVYSARGIVSQSSMSHIYEKSKSELVVSKLGQSN